MLYFLYFLALFSIFQAKNVCYYHQKDDYTVQDIFNPKQCGKKCSVMPFFSPGNAIEAHISMIEDASDSIVIANPTFESWNKTCARHHGSCNEENVCTGCSLEVTHQESFPIFTALLNAVHLKKLSVKILTNNYSVETCNSQTTLLDWLHINGIEVRMYKSTTFLHAKFMMTDGGQKILLSSVNFSKTSFMQNREAGVIISDCDDCQALELYKSVFQYDWNEADEYILSNEYSKDQLEYITDSKLLLYALLKLPSERVPRAYVSELKTFTNTEIVLGYVAPDYARKTFLNLLNSTRSSLIVHIFIITDAEICDAVVELHKHGVNVTVLVSKQVTGFQRKKAQQCYKNLSDAGISVTNTYTDFSFSHQKYWIIDGETVHLSTGNWAHSDFPTRNIFPAYKYPRYFANRDMIVIMKNPEVVNHFLQVFEKDKALGEKWSPLS